MSNNSKSPWRREYPETKISEYRKEDMERRVNERLGQGYEVVNKFETFDGYEKRYVAIMRLKGGKGK